MPVRRMFCLLFALLLAGCATTTHITQSWRDRDYHGPRFEKVLVIGFGDDGARRRIFEDRFVAVLRASGVAAVASYTLVPGLAEADLPHVREAVGKSAADAVLSVRLVGVDKRVNVYPAQPMFVPAVGYRRGFYNYYSSVMMTPPSTYSYEVVTLETNLWQASGDGLVWSATSESFAPEDAGKGAAELARTLVDAMRGQGLL